MNVVAEQSELAKRLAQAKGSNPFGLLYRDRAAKIANELAREREANPTPCFSGKAPGELGGRDTGPLTLPGWGRCKRKLDEAAEAAAAGATAAPNLRPLVHSVSADSLVSLSERETPPRDDDAAAAEPIALRAALDLAGAEARRAGPRLTDSSGPGITGPGSSPREGGRGGVGGGGKSGGGGPTGGGTGGPTGGGEGREGVDDSEGAFSEHGDVSDSDLDDDYDSDEEMDSEEEAEEAEIEKRLEQLQRIITARKGENAALMARIQLSTPSSAHVHTKGGQEGGQAPGGP